MERDVEDHMHFCPLQSDLGQRLCTEHEAPTDITTAVLIDGGSVYTQSSAILKMFAYMGFPWVIHGLIALCVPSFIRNVAYRAFSRHRGTIWKGVKRLMGWGDVCLEAYRGRILGIEDMPTPLPQSWGFGEACSGFER